MCSPEFQAGCRSFSLTTVTPSLLLKSPGAVSKQCHQVCSPYLSPRQHLHKFGGLSLKQNHQQHAHNAQSVSTKTHTGQSHGTCLFLQSLLRAQSSAVRLLSAVSSMMLFPDHYNRFQMVLENSIDSEHQKKSVIL